jgi:hypothetical protein
MGYILDGIYQQRSSDRPPFTLLELEVRASFDAARRERTPRDPLAEERGGVSGDHVVRRRDLHWLREIHRDVHVREVGGTRCPRVEAR